MVEVRRTPRFIKWLRGLRDPDGLARIRARLERLEAGHAGDVRWVGEAVLEMRVHSGPGYRIYFTRRGKQIVILLAGGDKHSQRSDIRLAIQLAREM